MAALDEMPATVIGPLMLSEAKFMPPDNVNEVVDRESAVMAVVVRPPAAVMTPDALRNPLENRLVAVTGCELESPAADKAPLNCTLPAVRLVAVIGPPLDTEAAVMAP